MARQKKLGMKALRQRCDRLCSWVVRYGESDSRNIGVCITCGKRLPADKANNCHFISRACLPLRWDLRNEHYGCVRCFTGDTELLDWKFRTVKQKDIKAGDFIMGVNTTTMMPLITQVKSVAKAKAPVTQLPTGQTVSIAHEALTHCSWEDALHITKTGAHSIMNIWKRQ